MLRPALLLALAAAASLTDGKPITSQLRGQSRTLFDIFSNLGALGGLTTQWSCDETTGMKSRMVQTMQGSRVVTTTETKPCDPVDCQVYPRTSDPGPWGTCTLTRDGWFKSKVLGLQIPAKYGGFCPEDVDRTVRERCPPVNCVVNTPTEDTGPFNACRLDADGWFKHKVLGIKTAALYGGTCPSDTAAVRDYREACPPVACVIKTSAEDTGSFGACRDDGDGWWKHKVLGVKTAALYGGTCPAEADAARDYRERCPPVNCVVKTSAEDTGPLGACRDDGDGWWKHKVLGIKTAAIYGGTCPAETDAARDYRERCPPVNCVVKTSAEDTGPLGLCRDDGDGWWKHKVLGIKTPAIYGGTCPAETDAARDYRERCPPENCVIKTSAEDTGSFGACRDDGDGWWKHKVLGVKTAAKYGGTCPAETDAARDYREPCPPVPCVVNTAAEDAGAFGACAPDGEAWTKSKVLGIKTPALYGGTCPSDTDPARSYKEVCPPVPCVVKTSAEDTGAFTPCQQEATGWFKYKTLGIKTPAQYGGSCPGESDRTFRTQCTRSCVAVAPQRGITAASYYEILTASSSSNCCSLCRERPRCESYVFYTHNRQCWIQSAQRTLFTSVSAVGGRVVSA